MPVTLIKHEAYELIMVDGACTSEYNSAKYARAILINKICMSLFLIYCQNFWMTDIFVLKRCYIAIFFYKNIVFDVSYYTDIICSCHEESRQIDYFKA